MPLIIGTGIAIGGGITVSKETPTLVIATNSSGGLTGYGPTILAINDIPGLTTTFPAGSSTITFQDGAVRTIAGYDLYPGGIDIFWTGDKTGILFPITLTAP